MRNIIATVTIVAVLFMTGCVGGTTTKTVTHPDRDFPNYSSDE